MRLVVDPYLQPNGTLRNHLGIADAAKLAEAEDQITTVRQAILDKNGLDGPFDFDMLQRIHRDIFQDVYDWAGQPRVCNLRKGTFDDAASGEDEFVPFVLIAREAARIFTRLADKEELIDLDRTEFAIEAADLFVDLNNLHPFREGNGRTQRLFLKALATHAGHELAFDVITRERMIAVSVEGLNGDREPARRLFTEISDPDRVAALRKALDFLKSSRAVSWNDLYIATTVAGQEYSGVLVGETSTDFMIRVHGDPQDWIAIGSVDDLPADREKGSELTITVSKFR